MVKSVACEMAQDFKFESTQDDFKKKITQDISQNDLERMDCFMSAYKSALGTDADKRSASDQALRVLITYLLGEKIDPSKKKKRLDAEIVKDAMKIITLSVSSAKQGLCSASMPFILLGDILDCLTLGSCDPVFCYIEERVAIWKSPQFYSAGKNYLLRMCNDLLRRLSQAQNTVFCGRIQLFLARLFPLSEKSALNLVSQFNNDNVTIFNENRNESILKRTSSSSKISQGNVTVDIKATPQKDEIWLDGTMEVDQNDTMLSPIAEDSKKQEKSLIVDYDLYHSIWSLQDIFRSPVQCYNKEKWDKFTTNADAVFRVFSSFKLDEGARHFSDQQQHNKAYFAKFLTSEKLINLQLNDSMFRRQILCQILILFQYLTGTVKFKSTSAVLTDKQKEWLEATKKKIYELLKETPPEGKQFSSYIKHFFAREEFWIRWKNEGCPSFIKTRKVDEDLAKSLSPPAKRRKVAEAKAKKSSIAEDFISGKPLGMGSPELTRLWDLCHDNLDACKSDDRKFLPSLEGFFSDSIELMDPKNMVEEEYQSYNEPNFQWKALRLLSQRSPLFFASQPAPMQFKTVSQYLKGVIEKLSKEFPQNVPEQSEIIQDNDEIKEMEELNQQDQDSNEKINIKEEQEDNDLDDNEMEDDDDEVLEDEEFDNDDALLNDDSQHEDGDSDDEGLLEPISSGDALSSDEITTVAQKIAGSWEKLAPFLDLQPKDIAEIKEDSEDVILQARQTLVTWQDRNKSEAKRPALIQALNKANMEQLAKDIS